jgi:CheY-like chemotaxis protein
MPEPRRITVVNDNPEFLELVGDLLRDERYVVTLVDGDRADAVDLIRRSNPSALMIDLRLGSEELHGWEVIKEVRRDPELSELPTLICSGDLRALDRLTDDLASMRRVATLSKPFDIDQLYTSIGDLLEGATAR